jgi:hypothetical protein
LSVERQKPICFKYGGIKVLQPPHRFVNNLDFSASPRLRVNQKKEEV